MNINNVLDYWFPQKNTFQHFWFSDKEDNNIYNKFHDYLIASRNGKLDTWNDSISGMLAKIILHDQMSRNMFRNNDKLIKRAGDDEIALIHAKKLIKLYENNTELFRQDHLMFICLPLRHTKKYEYCLKVINLIKNAEMENKIITNYALWMKFKIASYMSYFEHLYLHNKKAYPIIDFVKMIKKYSDVLDSSVNLLNWNPVGDINEKITKTIWASIKNFDPKGNAIIVSLSGGVDSMVILHCLHSLSIKYKFKVIALHIEYINRREAIHESNIVEMYCHTLGVIYHTVTMDYILRPETTKLKLTDIELKYKSCPRDIYEHTTKTNRFKFYIAIIKKYNAKLIALGHHNDDLIENVIANVMSGRDISDLTVLNEYKIQHDAPLWRPLLTHSKQDILDYADKYGIPYMYNSTPPLCMRGRMRLELLPLLKSIFPSFKEGVQSISNQSIGCSMYFKNNIVDPIVKSVVKGKIGFAIPISLLINAPINVWTTTFSTIIHSFNMPMIKGGTMNNIIKNINAKTEFTICAMKNYSISYMPNTKMVIFLDRSYFWSHNTTLNANFEGDSTTYKYGNISTRLIKNPSNNRITSSLKELLNGTIKYTIDENYPIVLSNSVPKKMKRYLRSFFNCSMKMINNFVWIMSKNINEHNLIVEIIY